MESAYVLGLIKLAMKRSLTEEQYQSVIEEYKRLLKNPVDENLRLLQEEQP